LTLAVRHGIAARADRTAAEALIRRFFVRGALLGQQARAAEEQELVAAHTARFPGDGALRWLAANNRGAVAYRNNDLERARRAYHEALAVTAGPTPLDLARTRINLGLLEFDARDYEAALASHRMAIAQASAALGEAHPLVRELATYEAAALYALGRKQAARERLAAYLEQDTTDPSATQRSIWPAIRLSRIDSYFRRHASARALAERALAATPPDDELTQINAEMALADTLTDPHEATTLHARVIMRCQNSHGMHHPILVSFLQRVGANLLRLQRSGQALVHLERALATGVALGTDPAGTAETRRLLSDAELAHGNPEAAADWATAAITTLTTLPGDHSLDLALTRRTLGLAHLAMHVPSAAIASLRAALATLEPRLDPDDPALASTRHALAQALLAADPENHEARLLLRQARDIYISLGDPFTAERTAVESLLTAPTN
jgi:tetratricopeptide (TPR) repeat protein